nr:MAG TPA: protein of unknown function DUF859 [Caudoviricetes sp.]
MPSFNISSGVSSLYLIVTYTVGQYDVVANTTPVSMSLSLHHAGLSVGAGTDDCALTIGSQTYKWTGPDIYSSGAGTVSLGSHKFTVPHNADGTWSGKIGASYRLNINYGGTYIGTISGDQTITLPTIPRASTVSATDANIGSVSSIYINAKSSAFSHGLLVTFGDLSFYLNGDGSIASSYVTFTQRTVPFRLPDSFYAQIPNAATGKVTLTLWTHTDKDHYFDPETTTFTATAAAALCAPTVSATCQDANEKTLALTGNADALVRYASTASGSLSVAARNSASIKRITVAGREVPLNATSYSITNVETNKVTVTATDSRGYSTTQTIEKTLVPYVQLTCNILRANRPVPSSNEAQIEVSGQYFAGNFGAADNTLALKYQNPSGDWVAVTPTIDTAKNTYTASITVPDLDYRQAFSIPVQAEDKLFTATNTAQIMAGVPSFYWTKEFFQLNVPLRLSNSLGYVNMPILYMENDTADTEERFEAALTEKLAQMPNESMTFVLWSCHPKVTGQNVYSALIKHNANYAVLVGFSYGLKVAQMFTKTLWNGIWQESHPTTL